MKKSENKPLYSKPTATSVKLLTFKELSEALNVNDPLVRRWHKNGIINPRITTPSGRCRFDLDQVVNQLVKYNEAKGKNPGWAYRQKNLVKARAKIKKNKEAKRENK